MRLYSLARYRLGAPGVSEFRDHSTAVARVRLAVRQSGLNVMPAQNRYAFTIVPAHWRYADGDDRVIVRMVANPKAVGTDAHWRWEMLVDGMTVGEYVALVGHRKRAIRDLQYDVERNYVRLERYLATASS